MPEYFADLARQLLSEEGAMHLGLWNDDAEESLAVAQARLDAAVLGHARLSDGMAILDVGCGLGGTLARVNAAHQDMRLLGLNPDPDQLAIAGRVVPRGRNQLRWLQGRADRLPVRDGALDRVLCVEAAFHFASRARFLAEALRVLRPGGRLVLTDIVPTAKMAALGAGPPGPAFAVDALLQRGIGPIPAPFTPADWGMLFEAAGAHTAHIEDISAATLPSYRHFLTDTQRARPGAAGQERVMDEAVALLEWLQAEGYVQVVLAVAVRPATASRA